MTHLAQEAAQQVLEAVPTVMRTIRAQLRTYRRADISVPQFRAMGYLDRNQGASLSELANYIGLTMPSMSRLIEGLVVRKLVTRSSDPVDRRRICLSLTGLGRGELRSAHRSSERFLTEQLAGLPEEDLRGMARAMEHLKGLFAAESEMPVVVDE